MSVAVKATFWMVTFGGLGWGLFKVVKPSDELIKEIEDGAKHTDAKRLSHDTVAVLKQAADQSSELNKKIEDLLKK